MNSYRVHTKSRTRVPIIQRWWFWPLIVTVFLVGVTRGRIVVSLIPWLKFIIPATLFYLFLRYVKSRIKIAVVNVMQQNQQQFGRRVSQEFEGFRPRRDDTQGHITIEICPTCGSPRTAACASHKRDSL